MHAGRSRATGLLIGYVADTVLADPRRGHPVAAFGTLAGALERRWWRDSRAPGVRYTAALVGGTVVAGTLAERLASRPLPRTLMTAAATWVVLGGTSLGREGRAIELQLDRGLLPEARVQLTHLVGRDTSLLTESEVVRAAVESLAENTSDAVVAPLVWGAVLGVPGLLGYRAANTLDAMVGHRSARYERFGWASARLDDLLNVPGSRLTAGLAVLLGEDPAGAVRAWLRDAAGHPSPNAGPVEAAFAGALGITLGGANTYGSGADQRVEHRALLGDGPAPARGDLARARRLAGRVGLGALVVAVGCSGPRSQSSRALAMIAATGAITAATSPRAAYACAQRVLLLGPTPTPTRSRDHVSTSFTNPEREEPDAKSPVTDGPVQDSQSVEEERGVPDREDVVGESDPEPPPADEHD